jgi:hypothetical protein
MPNLIRYLEHSEIDKERWDSFISSSVNGIIYACSWYLDCTAPGWDALILNDYEAVMPLPKRKKFGINYIFQPYLTQQLGVFYHEKEIDISQFFSHIPKKIRHVSLNLNEYNLVEENILKENKNFLLDISLDYASIYKAYTRNCKRNLKKAQSAGFQKTREISAEEFSNFIRENLEEKIPGKSHTTFLTIAELVQIAFLKGKGELLGLTDSKGILHAAGFFLKSNNRLIFSVCASTKYGKENQAMYLLVDYQIKNNCGQYDYFDFSGSNHPGIAYFNSTFGAVPTTYCTVQLNRLPSRINLLYWLRRASRCSGS